MMGAATLQPPKSGRSRFSKALPAPPSLPTFEFESQLDLTPLVPEKELPRLHPDAPLPPIPPPKGAADGRDTESTMAAMAKPLNSPLPPVPSKFTGPPPMSIPRRPVASPVNPTPGLAPASASVLASPDPSPSPVGSFSSLLSAYSNHTAESPRSSSGNSSKDLTNSKGVYSVVSPNLDIQRSGAQPGARAHDLPLLPSEQHGQKHQSSAQILKAGQEELPPPPPLKDAQRTISRPQTPNGLQTRTAQPPTSTRVGSPLRNSPPQQQEQLWRRRSRSRSLKGDTAPVVPDLKLVVSHGSTAASGQDPSQSQSSPSSLLSQPFPVPPRSNPGASESITAPRAPPRSTNRGLPGRNVRPAAPPEQPAPAQASMGQEASRIKEKLRNVRRRGSTEEPKVASQPVQVSRAVAAPTPATPATVSPVSQRPPTPEYGTNDIKSALPETVVSPLSPASSPELPGEPKPIVRKAVNAPQAQIRPVTSSPSLAPGPINTGLGMRPPMGLPLSPRPGVSQDLSQPPLSVSPAPQPNQSATQPQYRPSSPAPDRTQSPSQKQYIPYSPPSDRKLGATNPTQLPAQPSSREDNQQPLPAAPRHEQHPSYTDIQQQNPWSQPPPTRDPLPRTVSETGSIETVKAPSSQAPVTRQPHPNPPPAAEPLLPLREPPSPTESELTTNPGAALFPRGWYTPQPPDSIPDARPLTERHFSCLTAHRYMTANRQRTNPVACRTCGHKDRFSECYICSACYLCVCKGCVGLVRRWKGDLRGVLGEVENLRKKREEGVIAEEGGEGVGERGDGYLGRVNEERERVPTGGEVLP